MSYASALSFWYPPSQPNPILLHPTPSSILFTLTLTLFLFKPASLCIPDMVCSGASSSATCAHRASDPFKCCFNGTIQRFPMSIFHPRQPRAPLVSIQ